VPEGVCQIQVSHSDRDALEAIVQQLLDQRWEGEVQREQEWLALLKTSAALAPDVQARIAELHPYDVPEILVTEVAGGHPPYLRWVLEQTSGGLPGSAAG